MDWWCTATSEPWSWSPRAYPGIWLAMSVMLVSYLVTWRHRPPSSDGGLDRSRSRRKKAAFITGWLLLWVATDWPLGFLGASYLASAHMAQYVIYTMAAAPLLVVGTPEWMLRRVLSKLRAYRLVSSLAKPLVAGLLFNMVLIATHAPVTVDALRTNQLGSFLLDAAWLGSALLLWLPVCGPLEELKPALPFRGVYLFLAAGVVPMIPGGFLTFADTPLYAIYELAPRVDAGFDARSDQQFAGAIMKVGNIPLLWPVLVTLFFRWAKEEREGDIDSIAAKHAATATATATAKPTATAAAGNGSPATPNAQRQPPRGRRQPPRGSRSRTTQAPASAAPPTAKAGTVLPGTSEQKPPR